MAVSGSAGTRLVRQRYRPGRGAEPSSGGLFDRSQSRERAAAIAAGSVAALPRALRPRLGSLHPFGSTKRLQALLARWSEGSRMNEGAFASHFLGRDAEDRTAQALRAAAGNVANARNHDDLRRASEHVAAAMQAVGPGSWGRFLADAEDRANEPATIAAVAASQRRPEPAAEQKPDAQPHPASASEKPAGAAEPEHGKFWWWLHSLGLANTRHEQADILRRGMGAQGGVIYYRDGVPLNVEQMSEDEVLELYKQTRGQPVHPLPAGVAAPIMTQWGWDNAQPYIDAWSSYSSPERTKQSMDGCRRGRRRCG